MLIKFWLGLTLTVVISILLMLVAGWYTKKRNKGAGVGAIIAFFVGFALVIATFLVPRRLYVVVGDESYDHYMVLGSPEYEMPNGEKLVLDMTHDNCVVVNETELPVVLEEQKYGGYGFSGSTDWVNPGESFLLESHLIFYLYDDEPPEEISVKDDSEETIRWWLRKKRD